jgi:hypothetical protein
MPRQSDSIENQPGEKVMMRKLAVTVFALSFAALGCGSDSGTSNLVDTGITPAVDSGAKDTSAADAHVTPDVTAATVDTAKQDDVATPSDVAVSNDTNTQVDVGLTVDASAQADVIVPALDGAKPSVDTAADSGETQKPVDSGTSIDSGSVDGGVLDGGSIG